jgi:aminoglycoside phosphotransferase (APT) family kinase protein
VQAKNLLKKNTITVVDGRQEVIKAVGTPFKSLTRIWCRHEAECLSQLEELGFASAPKLISSTVDSFTMEKIEGTSLHGRAPIDETLFIRLMDVISELHDFGFAHGNLRPNNIIVKAGNEPALIDFESCCRIPNPLFLLARFSDLAWLHWLWQSRVVQSDPELVRAKFPRYVLLAMSVITPIGKLRVMAMDARKRHRKSRRVSS